MGDRNGNHIRIGGDVTDAAVVAGDDNQVAMRSPGAEQVRELTDDDAAVLLRELVQDVRARLADLEEEADLRRDAEPELVFLEAQVERRPLSRTLIRQVIESSRALAEGIAGNAAFAGLVAWLAS